MSIEIKWNQFKNTREKWFMEFTWDEFWKTYQAQAVKLGIPLNETKDELHARMLREGYKFKDEVAEPADNEFGPVTP